MSDEKEELYYALEQSANRLRKEHGQSLFKLVNKILECDGDPDKAKKKLYDKLRRDLIKSMTRKGAEAADRVMAAQGWRDEE